MKQAKIGLWLVALGVWLFVGVTYLHADEPGDVRGCWAKYNPQNGKFSYEPFLKIAHEKTWASEYGFPEVWGYRVWNLEPPDKNGITKPVNILEGQFVELGKNKEVQMYPDNSEKVKATRCPNGLW
jgi:hypothetical protein